jgi:peptidoglycan/LPS O-acetylase OafA/YrhL
MQYRREVDGLRAVAVLPVLLFHAGYSQFAGGFVGVDIFFVISGYLITSIILHEQQSGRFTITGFYERRARRILPALFFVMLLCVPAAWAWLAPADLENFGQSIAAVTVFASNILFWITSGYFESASELKPLLHTWSLAVEEQYYVFFPLLIMMAWPLGKRWIVAMLVLISLISLALAQHGVHQDPSATFYLLHTRCWELLIGALAAFYLARPTTISINTPVNPLWNQLGSLMGVALIMYAIAVFDEHTPFPSVYALIPVIGAVLIIICAQPENLVGKLLGHKLLVGLGLISYSLYLWHQPLFSFARHMSIERPSPLVFALLIGISVLLAAFTWKYVEAPFRDRSKFTRLQIFALAAIGSVLFAAAGISMHLTQGYVRITQTPEQQAVLKTAVHSPKRNQCHNNEKHYLPPDKACEYHVPDVRWAVFGDSHTVELAYALAGQLAQQQIGLKHFSSSACVPMFGRTATPGNNCAAWTQEAVQSIANDRRITHVVVSYRILLGLYGDHEGWYPQRPNRIAESERAQRWESYMQLLKYLTDAGKKVTLVLQAPELPKRIDVLVHRQAQDPRQVAGASYAWWKQRSQYVTERLGQVPSGVKVIDPAALFCADTSCAAVRGGIALYFDDDHMSVAGASLVATEILRQTARL